MKLLIYKDTELAKMAADLSIFSNYAFHTGGRSEIQFNIGIEKNTQMT